MTDTGVAGSEGKLGPITLKLNQDYLTKFLKSTLCKKDHTLRNVLI